LDLDLNLGFKFKSAAKMFQKYFHFLLATQNRFRPSTPCSPPILFLFSLIFLVAGPVSFSAQCAQPTRLLAQFRPALLPSSSFGHQVAAATDSICRRSASRARRLRLPDHLLDASTPSPGSAPSFPLPLNAKSKLKSLCLEAPPSCHRLLPDCLCSLASAPIKGTDTPSHLTPQLLIKEPSRERRRMILRVMLAIR
jgi:hypothetical protein